MVIMQHRTEVSRGQDFAPGSIDRMRPSFVAHCVKECGWVGHRQFSSTEAEREGEDHESYMVRIES
jgi:hypothetical protein